jgi:hypothetical protein
MKQKIYPVGPANCYKWQILRVERRKDVEEHIGIPIFTAWTSNIIIIIEIIHHPNDHEWSGRLPSILYVLKGKARGANTWPSFAFLRKRRSIWSQYNVWIRLWKSWSKSWVIVFGPRPQRAAKHGQKCRSFCQKYQLSKTVVFRTLQSNPSSHSILEKRKPLCHWEAYSTRHPLKRAIIGEYKGISSLRRHPTICMFTTAR